MKEKIFIIMFCIIAFVSALCVQCGVDKKENVIVADTAEVLSAYDSLIFKVDTSYFYTHKGYRTTLDTAIPASDLLVESKDHPGVFEIANDSVSVTFSNSIVWLPSLSTFPNAGDIVGRDNVEYDSAQFIAVYLDKRYFETLTYSGEDTIGIKRSMHGWLDVMADTVVRIRKCDSRIFVVRSGYDWESRMWEDHWVTTKLYELSTGEDIDTALVVKLIPVHGKEGNK